MLTLNLSSAREFSLWGALQQCTRSMWLSWQGPREPRALAQAGLSVVWTPLGDEKGWLAGSADGNMRKWRWNSRPGKGWFRQYYLTAHAQGTGKAEITIMNVLNYFLFIQVVMVNIKILLDFPYTLLDFLMLILCLILFLKYILRAEIMRNVIIFQWTWVWANSGRPWRTGKPDVLQSMGSQSRTWLNDWTTTRWLKQ